LELGSTDELRPVWLDRLLDVGLVASTGRTQAVRYFVSPDLLKGSGLDEKTTLRRLEPHRLRALIVEDLRRYPGAASGDINRRVGPEVPYRTLKRAIDDLVAEGSLRFEGLSRGRRYWYIEGSNK
jgi:ATP-dependent DNA helicase RecG